MYNLREIIDNYISGNISAVKQQINKEYSFSEMFDYFVDDYNPSMDDIKLFVSRLTK